jgi:hypothetical protein
MLVLRVEFDPTFEMKNRGVDLEKTDEVMRVAANQLVTLAHTFPDMISPAVEIVTSVLGHDMRATPSSTLHSVLKAWQHLFLNDRSTSYVCEHCKVSSLKDLWGPGRITCPKCGKMANAADGTPRP